MSPAWQAAAVASTLLAGLWLIAVLDAGIRHAAAGTAGARVLVEPFERAALLLVQQKTVTERPDAIGSTIAPLLYLALATIGLSMVPYAEGAALANVEAGIVLWGAVESATVVAVFLHGWSANSLFPLIGGYRYVATGLSAMLVSMFVLIATALPAESLALGPIVEAQSTLWNVVAQPLGLPLFVVLGLSVSLAGPMDYADSADLAGGTSSETSGSARLGWTVARYSMMLSFAAVAASCFLGGYLGPWLPGPVWLALKTLLVLCVIVALRHRVVRMPASRMLGILWLVLLPVSFVGLAIAGVAALP